MKNGIERSAKDLGLATGRTVHAAQAIAEGKLTVAGLERLIRLEEFLREDERKAGGIKVVFHWTDDHGNPIEDSVEPDE